MGDGGARADGLDGEVQGALEVGGRGRHDGLVVGRPDRDPDRAGGRLVAGVQRTEQVAVGLELLAGDRAGVRGEVTGKTGEVGAVVRRPDRDDPAREAAAAVVADPEAGDHAAGGVPDHVHRAGAGPLLEEDRGLLQHLRLLVEVAEPVAGELHDHGLAALRAQGVGHHLEPVRAAAVPRHEQHRAGGRLRDRRAPGPRAPPTRPPRRRPRPTTTSRATASTNRRRAGARPSSTLDRA